MKAAFLHNLQFRVALILLLVALVPLGVVSLFAVRTAEQVIHSIVTSELENVAAEKQNLLENVAAEKQALLERWITERKADLEVVARSDAVRSRDAAQIRRYLNLVQSQYLVYKRWIVVGPEGRMIDDSAGDSQQDYQHEPWYRQAMQGKPYFSEVTLDADRRESVFRLATAIRGEDGSAQGAVCATVSTEAIVARVLRVSLGETGECYLVDSTGTFLAHKEPARILRDNIAQSESFTNVLGESRPRQVYTDYRGIPVLGASRAVAGTPWYLVVEQDRDEAFASSDRLVRNTSASSDRLVRNICLVIALTAAVAVGLSWLLAMYVSAPIRALSESAHALSRGDFENALVGARSKRSDEIGALYAAFRHMASQLWNRHASLEQRIGVTEAELRRSDTRLKQTLEAAARSEHLAALGRLAAGVAHEIRTPLTSLKLFLQAVRDEITPSPEHAEDFQIAMQEVRRIESTINHFLDFARPQQPSLAEVDFRQLLDDALLVVHPRANQQEVEVTRSIAADLPQVEGDMRQLGEAVVNLLANALDAMPDGGRLAIAVCPEANAPGQAERRWVRIDVSDTGPGIREENLDRLFEPFFTTKATGSGLGLAIVQGTIQCHGGLVKVYTQPGQGTTFSIYLPPAAARTAEHGIDLDRRQ